MTPDSAEHPLPDWQVEIAALEDEATRAFLARDLARLDELWSDELIVNSPVNRVLPKHLVLDLLGKGVIAHHAMELRPEVYRRDGDFVFVLGADIVQDTPESPKVLRRFTNVWRREHGAWRLFVRHANLAPGGPPAGGAPEAPETRR